MKIVIDACVLFPTVLRELALGLADTGTITPLWSPRILEEWRRAALRRSERDGMIAEGEIALLKVRFPEASVEIDPATEARLVLPDPDDVHVLAAAIDGAADALMTLSLRDFPTNALSAQGILRRDPDGVLLEAFHADEAAMHQIVSDVLGRAVEHGIDTSNPRALLKRARVPRLGKAMFA